MSAVMEAKVENLSDLQIGELFNMVLIKIWTVCNRSRESFETKDNIRAVYQAFCSAIVRLNVASKIWQLPYEETVSMVSTHILDSV